MKDASHGGWAFYSFGKRNATGRNSIAEDRDLLLCHEQNAAVDTTFVQFYPTLIDIAKAKGTFAISSAETTPKRYALDGVVKSVDTAKHSLVVQHGDIPGFMAAMTMSYDVGKTEDLAKVTAGDHIHADVVVNADVKCTWKISL